jgi:Fe-Mn family superoxide dismutase
LADKNGEGGVNSATVTRHMGERGELKRRIHMSDGVERRNLIQAGGLAAGAAVAAMFVDQSALAQNTAARGTPVTYQPKPLSLDPKSIKGISEKVIISHYENNYVGAVKRLTAISAQLAELDFAKAPNFLINGLKREELIATNSMILHEIYFDGLGGGGAPTGTLAEAITREFGSVDR